MRMRNQPVLRTSLGSSQTGGVGHGGNVKNTATVKIFLAEGDPDSIRTAEISNWSGKAVAGPRSQLELILGREEAGKPGVYFLAGVHPETGRPTRPRLW
jgi:hypothetical protein